MVVCFSIGSKSSNAIVTLKKSLDDVDFISFSTLPELVKETNLRHIRFDRIIISNNIVGNVDKELKDLNDFIKNYSSSTEIVLMLNTNLENYEDVAIKFASLFNSPLYAIVDPGKTTVKVIKSLVKDDIVSISEMYTPSFVKNFGKSKEFSSELSDIRKSSLNSGEITLNLSQDKEENSTMNEYIKDTENGLKESSATIENSNNLISSSTGSVSVGISTNSSENLNFSLEDLSIGGYGSSHSDTGFLTAEDKEEIEEYKKLNEVPVSTIREEVDLLKSSEENVTTVQESSNTSQGTSSSISKERRGLYSNVNIILSPRCKSNAKDLVSESKKIAKSDGARVLIIDLDLKGMSLVSNFNVGRFFTDSFYNVLDSRRFYFEDDIYLASTGGSLKNYVNIGKKILDLLDSSIGSFDMIYLYCPTDCIKYIPEEILTSCVAFLNPGDTVNDIVQTSLDLTSRDCLTIDQEVYIMSNVYLDVKQGLEKGIMSLRKSMFFVNGCWMDRLGL